MFDFLAAELKYGESVFIFIFFIIVTFWKSVFNRLGAAVIIYFFQNALLCCDSDVAGSLSTFSHYQCTQYQPAS